MPKVRMQDHERTNKSDPNLFQQDKRVPPGSFVVLTGLPAGMTDDEVSEWVYERIHLDIPVDHIAVRNYPSISTALVSVPRSEIVRIFNWLLTSNSEIKGVMAKVFGPNSL